ncbi:universal stress protein [Gammaproteobacteria bacterium AH-315-C21]|nr:universal stress protein [Gammaproteobacteria bacterium AH-315-C21]
MVFKKILVAFGYGEDAEEIVQQAKYIAYCHQAKLVFVHVVEPLLLMGIPEAYGYYEMLRSDEEAKVEEMARMDKIIHRMGVERDSVKKIVRFGSIKNEIIDCAKAEGADLIFVGAHEKRLSGFYLGSIANAVLHQSTVNVLVTKTSDNDKSPAIKSYKRILIAIEFMPEIDKVINQAKELAEKHEAELTMVHVVNRAPVFEMPLSLFEIEIVEKVERQFEQLAQDYGLAGAPSQLLLGSPGKEIVDYAKKEAIDLIVMGSHGRHGAGLLLGSTANSVFHRSHCDVLAVRL